jgi:hypothetical protein
MHRLSYTVLTLVFISAASPVHANDPVYLWSQHFGDIAWQKCDAVAVDGAGNVAIGGYFEGTIDLGGGPFTTTDRSNICIAKFDNDKRHLWSKHIGEDDSPQQVTGIAFDSRGNVIVTGEFWNRADFGGGMIYSAGHYDIFVVKYDPNGDYLWGHRFGNSNYQTPQSITIDHTDNIIISGYFWDDMVVGAVTLDHGGGSDVFVIKITPSGQIAWGWAYSGSNTEWASGVASDDSGNLFIGGWFKGTLQLGQEVLQAIGWRDAYIAKLEPNGNVLWYDQIGQDKTTHGYDVACDSHGNVIFVGAHSGPVNFGGETLETDGTSMFVAKYDPSGAHVWSRSDGDGELQVANRVRVNERDEVFVMVTLFGSIELGGRVFRSKGRGDILIVAFDADGEYFWCRQYGDYWNQPGGDIALGRQDDIAIAGNFQGSVDFGGGAHRSANEDIYVVKLTYPSAPWMTSLEDVPADQGGYIWIEFDRSAYDRAGSAVTIQRYEVLRLAENGAAWEHAATVAAGQLFKYEVTVATHGNAVPAVVPWTTYRVRAVGPGGSFDSPSDSGFSVDNLAPKRPTGLKAVEYVEGLRITWHANREPDIDQYVIYRHSSPDFTPMPDFVFARTQQPTVLDPDWDPDMPFYYKITAVDVHTNESPFAQLAPDDISKARFVLYQNYPNPFNPGTTITFYLPSKAHVKMSIYDASGKLVKTIVDDTLLYGLKSYDWDGTDTRGHPVASGAYFYRVETGHWLTAKKMILVR